MHQGGRGWKFEKHSSIRNDPDGLHNHFSPKIFYIDTGHFQTTRIFVVLVLGVLPPNLLKTELCLTHLAHFGLEKHIVFRYQVGQWTQPQDEYFGWSGSIRLESSAERLMDCQMFRNAGQVSWEQNPSTSQFTYNVTTCVFVFGVHSYIIFLFVVSCCWFCCSEKQCHEWVHNSTKIGWPFFTCWEISTSPCHACTIAVDGSEMPNNHLGCIKPLWTAGW